MSKSAKIYLLIAFVFLAIGCNQSVYTNNSIYGRMVLIDDEYYPVDSSLRDTWFKDQQKNQLRSIRRLETHVKVLNVQIDAIKEHDNHYRENAAYKILIDDKVKVQKSLALAKERAEFLEKIRPEIDRKIRTLK